MNNQEVKNARKKLGLTQQQLGLILKTNLRTIQRWEGDENLKASCAPNSVACVTLGWFLEGFRPHDWSLNK